MWVRTVAASAVLCLVTMTSAFNLDTLHPVIFQGPVTDPGAPRGSSYFGYSVGLTKTVNGAWVLVGAPRATSTLGLHNISETGALFKCGTEQQPGCREVVLDEVDYSSGPEDFGYEERKDGAWIGGALDTVPSPNGRISVCGPRWMQRTPGDHFGNGVCYWMKAGAPDYSDIKLLPLIPGGDQVESGIRVYAYGQAGLSVHFAKNGSELLMGAPGVYNWKGTVVRFSSYTDEGGSPSAVRRRRRRRAVDDSTALEEQDIMDAERNQLVDEDDYFGYSVSSGEFTDDGQTTYIAGAPRAHFGHGKVFVFRFPGKQVQFALDQSSLVAERTGPQVGCYFGGAVLGADVSGDARSELLVGAPLYSHQPAPDKPPTGLEEGRVLVYRNLGGGRLSQQPQELKGDGMVRGRFGSALASVGDLDMDGYNDIAVGAPYEEEQRGAIYIYLGSPTGLSREYSQKIAASTLSPALRGFGISLSHGIDMDDNHYSDIAVGSYLSGEAVLLRARPVLRFHGYLSPSTDKLLPTDKQFKVRACLKYFGKHLPDTVPVSILMKIESRHVSCEFDVEGERQDNFTYERQLGFEGYKCDDFTVHIKSDNPDFNQPIQLSMNYRLSSTGPEAATHDHSAEPVLIATDVTKRGRRIRRQASPLVSGDLSEFCAGCPVVNLRSPGQRQATLSVPFSIGCSDVCQSDLSVSASIAGLTGSSFVIGASNSLDLYVNVSNAGEPASLPSVQVRLPQPIQLVRMPQLCSERVTADHVILTCDVRPHPFRTTDKHKLKLSLDVSQLKPGWESLVIGLNVSSAGQEVVPADNAIDFTIGLRTEADIAVIGQPKGQAQLYYDKKADRDESERNDPNYIIVEHRYQILRYLSSPVEDVTVSFLVPVNMTKTSGEHVRFLELYRPNATIDNRPLSCSIQTGYYLAADGDSFEEAPRTRQSRYELSDKQRRLLAEADLPYGDTNATTVMNCTEPGVSCALLQCPAVGFPDQRTSMVVKLSMRVKLHDLEPFVGDKDTLVISTIGLADIGAVPYQLQPLDDLPDLYQVHSILLPSSLQPFPVWIIVVTVIGSLMLLGLITYGLYKLGFFNRRRPEGAE